MRAGGTSFDALYVNVNGESGYFDRSLNVYGRGGRAVPRCGAPIRREAVHEPVVLPLPALPAACRRRRDGEPDGDQPRLDVRLTAWVHGRVQGVGMRWWIRSRALELGLVGGPATPTTAGSRSSPRGHGRPLEELLDCSGVARTARPGHRSDRPMVDGAAGSVRFPRAMTGSTLRRVDSTT